MATYNDVLTMVRDRLNEPTARFWTDAQLLAWISEGQRDIARRIEVIQSSTATNIVANQNDYTITANIVRVHRVEYTDPQGVIYALEYRDFNNMDAIGYGWVDVSATGRPCYYTLWGVSPSVSLTLFPKPDEAVTNGLRVYYYKYPDLSSSTTQSIELPGGWEDLIVEYCEYSALRKNKDPRWQEAKGLYEQKIEDMRQLTRRFVDQPGIIDYYDRQSNYLQFWGDGNEWW